MEEDNNEENKDSCKDMVNIRKSSSLESILKGHYFVGVFDQRMEEVNNCPFILVVLPNPHRNRTKALPEESLTDISCNKQRDPTSNTVAILEHLIKHDDNNSSKTKLKDNENSVSSSDVLKVSIHSRVDIGKGLTNCDQHRHEFLRCVEQSFLLFIVLVNF